MQYVYIIDAPLNGRCDSIGAVLQLPYFHDSTDCSPNWCSLFLLDSPILGKVIFSVPKILNNLTYQKQTHSSVIRFLKVKSGNISSHHCCSYLSSIHLPAFYLCRYSISLSLFFYLTYFLSFLNLKQINKNVSFYV